MLFCAAQAPEIFGRDQRYGVLPLYFSRALTRTDYALAKVAGLIVALLIVDLVPQAILFVGRVLVAADPATGLSNEAAAVPRFLFQGLLTAGLLGGLSALIAAWTPRRAYATAGIIAVSIIPPVLVALLTSLTGSDTHAHPRPVQPGRRPRRRERLDLRSGLAEPGDRRARPAGPAVRRRRARRHGRRRSRLTVRRYLRIADVTGPAPRPALAVDHVSRWYGNVVALNDVSFALGPGVTGLLGPNGAGKSTLLHLMAGLLQAVGGRGPRRGPDGLGPPRDVRAHRPGPRARGDPPVPDRLRVRPAQRAAPGPARPGRRGAAGHRDGRADRGRRPPDRHVLQGHAPAGQARRRARPRPVDPAARRAVQRHGPAPAAAHDGPAPGDGRGRPDDPLLLAHPRGGRAAGRVDPGRLRGPAGRGRRLPVDPPAHDRSAAHVPRPLLGRPRPRRGAARPPGGLRRRARRRAPVDPDVRLRGLHPGAARGRAGTTRITLFEVGPTDDSLESVFSYLVRR